jgi:hypothetical protein
MAQPGWTGDGGSADSAWNRVQLGPYVLPGICTITGLAVGQDLDVKKQKGQDGAVMEDNGLEPAKFNIEVQINEELWPMFQEILPRIDPRRAGASRSPLEIVHPLPNILDIREIVIKRVVPTSPTASRGMKWVFECLQWFPAPKPKKTTTKPKDAGRAALSPEDRARLLMYESGQAVNDDAGRSLSRGDMSDNTFDD